MVGLEVFQPLPSEPKRDLHFTGICISSRLNPYGLGKRVLDMNLATECTDSCESQNSRAPSCSLSSTAMSLKCSVDVVLLSRVPQ